MPIRLTPAVKAILIICAVVFLIQQSGDQFFGTHLKEVLALSYHGIRSFQFWQLFSYAFVHSDVMHLFFNLMMVAFIGSELEAAWGKTRFLRYYFFCILSSAVSFILLQFFFVRGSGVAQMMAGSSGAIYGLLVAYGLIFGERVLYFMMLFPMKAKHFIWVLAGLDLLTTVYSSGGGWAAGAQLTTMGTAFLYLWGTAYLALSRRNSKGLFSKKQKKRRTNHLKLIVNNREEFELAEDDPPENPKTWH